MWREIKKKLCVEVLSEKKNKNIRRYFHIYVHAHPPSLTYTFEIDSKGEIVLRLPVYDKREMEVWINEMKILLYWTLLYSILSLKRFIDMLFKGTEQERWYQELTEKCEQTLSNAKREFNEKLGEE